MNREEIKIQAKQFLEGAFQKGYDFDDWADGKDFTERDREKILNEFLKLRRQQASKA